MVLLIFTLSIEIAPHVYLNVTHIFSEVKLCPFTSKATYALSRLLVEVVWYVDWIKTPVAKMWSHVFLLC
jgi:hypothetical protein